MINKAASGAGFTRKCDYRRFKLTIGYTLFFAAVFFALSFAVSRFAAGDSRPLPAFVKTTVIGQLYLYNLVAFGLTALAMVIDPRMLIFDGIPTNRWNLYYKSGIGQGRLIFNKLGFCVGSVLRLYAIGAAGALALGFLSRSGESAAGVLDWVLALVLGGCMLLVLVMPGVFFGSFVYNRFVLSAVELVAAAGVVALLVGAGYTGAQDEAAAIGAIRSLVLPAPTAISVIALACLLLLSLGAYLMASSKIRSYEVEELDDEELMRLGVTKDIIVYERDEDDYAVAISGPELFDSDEDLPEPEFDRSTDAFDDEEEAPRKKKREKSAKPLKKEKKRRRSREDEDDDDDEDEE